MEREDKQYLREELFNKIKSKQLTISFSDAIDMVLYMKEGEIEYNWNKSIHDRKLISVYIKSLNLELIVND